MKIRNVLKQSFVSMCVSAGVLSIANIETIWREEAHRGDYVNVRRAAQARLDERLAKPATPANRTKALLGLRDALASVEIGPANPFAGLSTLRPLDAVLAKGVREFTRQAYRSPNYREESGYDLVAFEVIHRDETTSKILAYLEPTLEGPGSVPVVMIVSNEASGVRRAVYRAGELVDNQVVAPSVAQNLVARLLGAGVPFLSVAR